jgi:hypothetical protein
MVVNMITSGDDDIWAVKASASGGTIERAKYVAKAAMIVATIFMDGSNQHVRRIPNDDWMWNHHAVLVKVTLFLNFTSQLVFTALQCMAKHGGKIVTVTL